jgi:acetyl-CoA C-acetyltransferase
MAEAVIVAAGRSPIGRAFKGSLRDERPDDLLAATITGVLARVPHLDPALVEDLLVGCGSPAGESGFNIARVSAILAGLPHVPGATVNRYCASSLQTIRMAAHAIRAGEGEVFIAAGVESISRYASGMSDADAAKNPRFFDARLRSMARAAGDQETWSPGTGLPDIYIDMGQTAENVAELHNVTREAMDSFAQRSQELAVTHQNNGFYDEEIVPITTGSGAVVTRDDSPRATSTLESLASLAPVFRPNGTVTAGNACPLNDGAAALVIMSDLRAKALGITPLARIISTGVSALNPEIMGLGPVEASRQALYRAGLSIDDIDAVEINEAFAAQVLPSAAALGVPLEKLNTRGGAIALGHPFGMTGARIATTLLHSLQVSGGRYGLETMCVGGGQGMALIIERLA